MVKLIDYMMKQSFGTGVSIAKYFEMFKSIA